MNYQQSWKQNQIKKFKKDLGKYWLSGGIITSTTNLKLNWVKRLLTF